MFTASMFTRLAWADAIADQAAVLVAAQERAEDHRPEQEQPDI
jgi:hypothetical protein